MKKFLVKVSYEAPYLKTWEKWEEAGKIEVAIVRALRGFRSAEMRGRPIKEIKVHAIAESAISMERKEK